MRSDRESAVTGQLIHAYLQNKAQVDDRVIHLLFSANRWEKAYLSHFHQLLPMLIINGCCFGMDL